MPERPRILQMGPDPKLGGGMAAALRGLLESPLADRYELDVLPTYDGAEPLRRLIVYCLALARLVGWSLRGRGRIVHVHSTVRGSAYRKAVCVLVAKGLRRRVVLQVHSGASEITAFAAGRDSISMRLLGAGFAAADAVLAVSSASAAALERAYGISGVAVVPNAAPTVAPFVREERPDGVVRVAYLGGFANPVKGGEVLLQALELALPRQAGIRVTLAGPGELPPQGAELLSRRPAVEWAGWLGPDEKDELLRAAEIFVMPSLSEGLPMALLEAMAYGMAVVATAAGGIPEVVDHDLDGCLVPVGDPAAIAAVLCRLADDPELRRRLAGGARRRVGRLDADEVASRLDALYASLA